MCNTQTYYSSTKCPRLTHTCHTKDRQHSHHTQRENDTTNGGLPPSVLSARLFVCGVNAGGLLCGTCVLALGTLYLNNMSVYCTYIHTTYDFCMDNCGWRIWFLSQIWLKNMNYGSIFCAQKTHKKTSFFHKTFLHHRASEKIFWDMSRRSKNMFFVKPFWVVYGSILEALIIFMSQHFTQNSYFSVRIDSEIIFFSHNCPYRNHM